MNNNTDTFWLSEFVASSRGEDEYDELLRRVFYEPVAAQLAVHYFIGNDYQPAALSLTQAEIAELRAVMEEYATDYEFVINRRTSGPRYFHPGAPAEGALEPLEHE